MNNCRQLWVGSFAGSRFNVVSSHASPHLKVAFAAEIGQAYGFPANWLNDAAKGFVSTRHEAIEGGLPQFSNLRLIMPTAEYLLAMKCMASRIGSVEGETHDVADIVFLIRHLKLKSANDALDIVAAYYPKNQMPVKAQFLVEGLFEEGRI